jgi:hypothetical protein
MANNNKGNKSWYKKVGACIAIVAGIGSILGISIFGGKSIFGGDPLSPTPINFENNDIGNQNTIIIGDENTINYGSPNHENMENPQSNDYEDEKTSSRYYQGTLTKTGWESKFIGLRYTNPEGMTMYTEEELDEMKELKGGKLSGIFSQYELGYIELTTVFEMISKADDQPISVGVCVEKLIDEVDAFQFVESYKSQIAQYRIDQYPYINYTLISNDGILKIGNENYIMVSHILERNNDFLYMDSYFRFVGDRAIMIVIIFGDERARDNILDAFTAY